MTYETPQFEAGHPAHKLAYRLCVGAVIFNAQGKVFSGHRIQKDLPVDAPRWQWPQGGMDKGETPIEAAYREVAEETGITNIELIYEMPGWLSYDLPEALIGKVLKGEFRGQKQKWFAFRYKGIDDDIILDSHHQIEFEHWVWRPIDECADLVVPFKRNVYAQVTDAFKTLGD